MSRLHDLTQFYAKLDELERALGGRRYLSSFQDYRDAPERGVYFFFEPGEDRSDSGVGSRVVRVGTHALTAGSQSTLRQRLAQHRGAASGGGNHRGSIFRLLVGSALMASGGSPVCASWGVKPDAGRAAVALGVGREALVATERPVERAVSAYVGAMPFLWIDVPDEPRPESLRGFIERNSIALLSNHDQPAFDASSPG